MCVEAAVYPAHRRGKEYKKINKKKEAKMSGLIGTVSAFDANEQTWEEYCEILEQFFEANGINDGDKQRAILISAVGPVTYKLMRNLLSPQKPSSKTYDELVRLMKEHFNPKPSEIVQRFKFDSRIRQPGESISAYVAELRRLAQDCDYGSTLERMLRDRLVCGINDDRIQRRLLSETDLTFESAYKIALAAETANRNAQDLQQGKAACNRVETEKRERQEEKSAKGTYSTKHRENVTVVLGNTVRLSAGLKT